MADRRRGNQGIPTEDPNVRPPTPSQDPEMSDQELARHADAISRVFHEAIHVAELLRRKLRLQSYVEKFEGEQARLQPQVIELRREHADLTAANATLAEENERQMVVYKADHVEAAQAEIAQATEEFRHASDAEKELIKEGIEEARRQAEIVAEQLQVAMTAERAEHAKLQAETQILIETVQRLRREIAAGVS